MKINSALALAFNPLREVILNEEGVFEQNAGTGVNNKYDGRSILLTDTEITKGLDIDSDSDFEPTFSWLKDNSFKSAKPTFH